MIYKSKNYYREGNFTFEDELIKNITKSLPYSFISKIYITGKFAKKTLSDWYLFKPKKINIYIVENKDIKSIKQVLKKNQPCIEIPTLGKINLEYIISKNQPKKHKIQIYPKTF